MDEPHDRVPDDTVPEGASPEEAVPDDRPGDEPAAAGGTLLDPVEARVLGCLLEKERTTPADYPLTLNALVRACNQSTSRWPVMQLSEAEVAAALERLKSDGLVRFVHSPSNRATKFRHVLADAWQLGEPELAVVCLLLLRGPQTVGELRTRSERLHTFEDTGAVEAVLRRLAARRPAVVAALGRAAGQKEPRWAEVLTGEQPPGEGAAGETQRAPVVEVRDDRLSRLEARVRQLEEELSAIRRALEAAVGPLDPSD